MPGLFSCSNKKQITTTPKMDFFCTQFSQNDTIPDSLSCKAGLAMKTPDLKWKNAPKDIQSWAVIMDDIDAIPVAGHIWTHWVVYNIPADKMEIGQNNYPVGSLLGQNSSGKNEYQGPCPPSGQLHHYTFRLYALNATSGLSTSGATAAQLRESMKGKVIDSLVLTGVFQQ